MAFPTHRRRPTTAKVPPHWVENGHRLQEGTAQGAPAGTGLSGPQMLQPMRPCAAPIPPCQSRNESKPRPARHALRLQAVGAAGRHLIAACQPDSAGCMTPPQQPSACSSRHATPSKQQTPPSAAQPHIDWTSFFLSPHRTPSPDGYADLFKLLASISPRFAVPRPKDYIPLTPSSLASTPWYEGTPPAALTHNYHGSPIHQHGCFQKDAAATPNYDASPQQLASTSRYHGSPQLLPEPGRLAAPAHGLRPNAGSSGSYMAAAAPLRPSARSSSYVAPAPSLRASSCSRGLRGGAMGMAAARACNAREEPWQQQQQQLLPAAGRQQAVPPCRAAVPPGPNSNSQLVPCPPPPHRIDPFGKSRLSRPPNACSASTESQASTRQLGPRAAAVAAAAEVMAAAVAPRPWSGTEDATPAMLGAAPTQPAISNAAAKPFTAVQSAAPERLVLPVIGRPLPGAGRQLQEKQAGVRPAKTSSSSSTKALYGPPTGGKRTAVSRVQQCAAAVDAHGTAASRHPAADSLMLHYRSEVGRTQVASSSGGAAARPHSSPTARAASTQRGGRQGGATQDGGTAQDAGLFSFGSRPPASSALQSTFNGFRKAQPTLLQQRPQQQHWQGTVLPQQLPLLWQQQQQQGLKAAAMPQQLLWQQQCSQELEVPSVQCYHQQQDPSCQSPRQHWQQADQPIPQLSPQRLQGHQQRQQRQQQQRRPQSSPQQQHARSAASQQQNWRRMESPHHIQHQQQKQPQQQHQSGFPPGTFSQIQDQQEQQRYLTGPNPASTSQQRQQQQCQLQQFMPLEEQQQQYPGSPLPTNQRQPQQRQQQRHMLLQQEQRHYPGSPPPPPSRQQQQQQWWQQQQQQQWWEQPQQQPGSLTLTQQQQQQLPGSSPPKLLSQLPGSPPQSSPPQQPPQICPLVLDDTASSQLLWRSSKQGKLASTRALPEEAACLTPQDVNSDSCHSPSKWAGSRQLAQVAALVVQQHVQQQQQQQGSTGFGNAQPVASRKSQDAMQEEPVHCVVQPPAERRCVRPSRVQESRLDRAFSWQARAMAGMRPQPGVHQAPDLSMEAIAAQLPAARWGSEKQGQQQQQQQQQGPLPGQHRLLLREKALLDEEAAARYPPAAGWEDTSEQLPDQQQQQCTPATNQPQARRSGSTRNVCDAAAKHAPAAPSPLDALTDISTAMDQQQVAPPSTQRYLPLHKLLLSSVVQASGGSLGKRTSAAPCWSPTCSMVKVCTTLAGSPASPVRTTRRSPITSPVPGCGCPSAAGFTGTVRSSGTARRNLNATFDDLSVKARARQDVL